MFPLHDDNPTRTIPVVTIALIGACAGVFFWELSLRDGGEFVYRYGVTPTVLLGNRQPLYSSVIPTPLTLLTAMFLHGGWMHLIGNMLFLWIFGNNVEDAMGHLRFIIFYVLCGIAATFTHALIVPTSGEPLIGASGAISGVLGAYVLLHPRSRVLVLLFLGFFFYTVRMPAVLVIGIWFGLQILNAHLAGATAGGVAWWAHIGGFVTGAVLILFFRFGGVSLFDRQRRRGSGR